jgi:hypothetical protein
MFMKTDTVQQHYAVCKKAPQSFEKTPGAFYYPYPVELFFLLIVINSQRAT